MGTIHVVVGGQYGSEGKGHVTAWLAKTKPRIHAVVRVAGPNAGHSAYDDQGRKWALRQVPIAAVTNPRVNLMIAAGSEVDPDVLLDEITRLEAGGILVKNRLFVDHSATVITQEHRHREAEMVGRIGSTGKGIGAARSDRIMRTAVTWGEWTASGAIYEELKGLGSNVTAFLATIVCSPMDDILIEGTQGYGLGLHGQYYPQCTSSDCRAIDFLAMAGLSPWTVGSSIRVWVVYRTFPIRVAGNSGPMYKETSWEALSEFSGGYIQPEKTTVTQKVRRVGEWDSFLAREALVANGGPSTNVTPVLLFLDYLFPEIADTKDPRQWDPKVWEYLSTLEGQLGSTIPYVGTGPNSIVAVSTKV